MAPMKEVLSACQRLISCSTSGLHLQKFASTQLRMSCDI